MKKIFKLLVVVTLLTITASKVSTAFAEEPEKIDTLTIPASTEDREMMQIHYTVKAGDSVWGIAEKTVEEYNINNDSVANISNRIKFINNISENDILPIGKNIVISFYK